MHSEHQSFVSSVPLAVIETQQHQSSSFSMDFFGDSAQFMRMYNTASSNSQPLATPETDAQISFVRHTLGEPGPQLNAATPNIQSNEQLHENVPESSHVRLDRRRLATQIVQNSDLLGLLRREDRGCPRIITRALHDRYTTYREAGRNAPPVFSMESNVQYGPMFFQHIEDMSINFEADVVDPYMSVLRSRLLNESGLQMHPTATAIIDNTFFVEMTRQWKQVPQPHSEHHNVPHNMYNTWKPPDELVMYIIGKTGSTTRPWYGRSELIMSCLIFSSWVVVHVNLIT